MLVSNLKCEVKNVLEKYSLTMFCKSVYLKKSTLCYAYISKHEMLKNYYNIYWLQRAPILYQIINLLQFHDKISLNAQQHRVVLLMLK